MKEQIEEMTCKNCIHYEVCMYVNAQAVEYARAENCKLFKRNAGYRKQSEWISVEDRLPESNKQVLVYYSVGKIDTAHYIRVDGLEFWFENFDGSRKVTHWMHLPEPPRKEGEGE